jgi:zinc protease
MPLLFRTPDPASALGVLASVGLLVAMAASAQAGEPRIKLDVSRHRLASGITVLAAEDRSAPTVSYVTFVRAGSRDEVKPGTSGIAHVFEHLMFKGTPAFPRYDDALARFGPETNASTSQDYTRYFVNVRSEYLGDVIRVEADRFRNLQFTLDAFRTELGPVREERRRGYVDAPDGFLFARLYETVFTAHTYHHPVIGYEEDLEKNITFEDTQDFRRAHYAPSGLTIVVAGGFETGALLALIGRYYGDWKPDAPSPPAMPPEPAQTAERREALTWKDATISPRLAMAFRAPALSAAGDYAALEVASRVLFMESQRIHARLYKDMQLVESVEGDVVAHRDPSLFYVLAVVKKGKPVSDVEAVVLEELERLKTDLVSDAELAKAKNALAASTLYALDRPFAVASALGLYETVGGDYGLLFALDQARQAVTKEAVRDVARRTFVAAGRSVLTLVPAAGP